MNTNPIPDSGDSRHLKAINRHVGRVINFRAESLQDKRSVMNRRYAHLSADCADYRRLKRVLFICLIRVICGPFFLSNQTANGQRSPEALSPDPRIAPVLGGEEQACQMGPGSH